MVAPTQPQQVPPPVLGLRMRSNKSCNSCCVVVNNNNEERIHAMIQQDQTSPYLLLEDKYNQRMLPGHNDGDRDRDCTRFSSSSSSSDVDTVCREKMVEWMYRVTDHFREDREMVAMAQSLLDRFVAHHKCCDRSNFKLAAMTALYICSKTNGIWNNNSNTNIGSSQQQSHQYQYHCHRPAITIQSLAELSRGEFSIQHIAEMERTVLETLQWRVNPPTIQSFIQCFNGYLPCVLEYQRQQHHNHNTSTTSSLQMIATAIYQRAMFFAELAVYDHAFVKTPRSVLALSAILNAMEGMDEVSVPAQQQDWFYNTITTTFPLKYQDLASPTTLLTLSATPITRDMIEDCRNRLWFVYSMSAQYRDEDLSASSSSSCNSSSRSTTPTESTTTTSSPQHVSSSSSKPIIDVSCGSGRTKLHNSQDCTNNINNHSTSSPVSVVVSPVRQQQAQQQTY